jgi:5-methylcytosine-specific restriction endonuclease McrA
MNEIKQSDNFFCDHENCKSKWQREHLTGKSNPNWEKGYNEYYGPNWREQRQKARERDNHTCQYCGVESKDLERAIPVHHIKSIRWYKEKYDEPEWYEKGNQLDNLVCLCQKNGCHQKWEGVPLRPQTD